MKFYLPLRKKISQWYHDSWLIITFPAFFGIAVLTYVVGVYQEAQYARDFLVPLWALFVLHVDKKWDSLKAKKKRSRSHSPPKKQYMDIIQRKKKKKNNK